jgi:prepilin-type N-terminal cleavage/methylation domain-containing protein
MTTPRSGEEGFTLVELTVTVTILAIIVVSFLGLFTSLVHSTIIAKRQAVASTLATNQMEYLKSLPYDNLAVAGGSIYATSPLPATLSKTVNGVRYTIKTSINYVDDAYDGCASYPTQALKELYCRNYPPPSGPTTTDQNPQDYKIANVTVTDRSNLRLAQVDTQISSRVSETASTTGALFVRVIDSNGNPVAGATVAVNNTTITPNVAVSDSTDTNGTAIFYGLPPDTNTDYHITGSKTGYSSLTTIVPSGSLQPTYPSQRILTQQSSYTTLPIRQQGTNSIIVETVDTAGNPLANVRVYMKGGYKSYTDSANAAYYYDNLTPSDVRPTTDASGLAVVQNLVPGAYVFCGDAGATSCNAGATTYYLAAMVPYGGTNPFNPVTVPTYDPLTPPTTTYDYNGGAYLQKVRLILSTSSTYPRVRTINPASASLSSGTLNNFPFTVSGTNLSGASVRFLKDSNTYTATCTGTTSLSCSINLTGITAGVANMQLVAGGNTLTMPADPLLGGLIVSP